MNKEKSNKIHLLPEHLIDQIKAGEVVEKPASLLKELIENSIDANSTKINIHIVNSGLDLISVIDDGDGIAFDQLPLAFHRHATSKIESFSDLYELYSFGFRGEALASIASMSRVSCTSHPKSGASGKIVFEGAKQIAHMKLDLSENEQRGTSLYIKDLFFNTPVRLKFVKSAQSEKNELKKIINSFLMAYPNIDFSIKWDELDRQIYPIENQINRLERLFIKKGETLDKVTELKNHYEKNSVRIYFNHLSTKGYTGKKHFLFVNGRYFVENRFHRNIIRSLEHFWGAGLTGNYCVFIDTPPEDLDVNVHPNKLQVKFKDQAIISSLISETIKSSRNSKSQDLTNPYIDNTNFNTQNLVDEKENFFNGLNYEEIQNNSSQQHMIQPGLSADLSESGENQFNINGRFSILNSVAYPILIDKENVLKRYLIDSFNNFTFDEANLSPLLISEVISGKNLNFIEKLNAKGIELEDLGNDDYALRVIPTFLLKFDYKLIMSTLIASNIKTFEDIAKIKFDICLKNSKALDSIIKNDLKYQSIGIQLTDNILERFCENRFE